jgi:hypothetical protein
VPVGVEEGATGIQLVPLIGVQEERSRTLGVWFRISQARARRSSVAAADPAAGRQRKLQGSSLLRGPGTDRQGHQASERSLQDRRSHSSTCAPFVSRVRRWATPRTTFHSTRVSHQDHEPAERERQEAHGPDPMRDPHPAGVM